MSLRVGHIVEDSLAWSLDKVIVGMTAGRLALYFMFAGAAVFGLAMLSRQTLERTRIGKALPTRAQKWSEIYYSLQTTLLWTVLSIPLFYALKAEKTAVYFEFGKYGYGYLFFSVVLMIVLHDTYFYWTHRLMHHPRVFRLFHSVHHRSVYPTPWATMSFHATEAVVQFFIVYLFVFFLPHHPMMSFVWSMWMFFFNTLGHLGHEFFPKWFLQQRATRQINSATHHALHHRYVNYNFGLYFTFWDRVMGTEHPAYAEKYAAVHAGEKI